MNIEKLHMLQPIHFQPPQQLTTMVTEKCNWPRWPHHPCIASHPFLPMVSITTSAGMSIPPWLLKSVIVGYNEKQLGAQLSIPRWVNLQRPKQLIKHDSRHFMWWYTCGYPLDILWTDAVSHFVLLVYLGPNWEEGLYHISMAFVTGSHECSPAILWNKMR